VLTGDERTLGEADVKAWFMNVAASDKISLDRSLPDTRIEELELNWNRKLSKKYFAGAKSSPTTWTNCRRQVL
jgi:hypothetical protein